MTDPYDGSRHIKWSSYLSFGGVAGYTPAEIKAMSMYEYSCVRSGWIVGHGGGNDANDGPEEGTPISAEDFERLEAAHEERISQATNSLTDLQMLARNKDKVRHS